MTVTQSPAIAVEIWLWDNAEFEAHAEDLCTCLSAEEQARRARKVKAKMGLHWAISRAKVRQTLSSFIDIPAQEIAFDANEYGQLSVANPQAKPLFFSISHDGSRTALAISPAAPIGVDIERVQRLNPDEMDWPLSIIERRDLANVASQDRFNAFFRYWTLKEAFIKALGTGVSFDLHSFSISPFKTNPVLLEVVGDPNAPADWTFKASEILPGLRFGLAVKTGDAIVNCAYHIKSA